MEEWQYFPTEGRFRLYGQLVLNLFLNFFTHIKQTLRRIKQVTCRKQAVWASAPASAEDASLHDATVTLPLSAGLPQRATQYSLPRVWRALWNNAAALSTTIPLIWDGSGEEKCCPPPHPLQPSYPSRPPATNHVTSLPSSLPWTPPPPLRCLPPACSVSLTYVCLCRRSSSSLVLTSPFATPLLVYNLGNNFRAKTFGVSPSSRTKAKDKERTIHQAVSHRLAADPLPHQAVMSSNLGLSPSDKSSSETNCSIPGPKTPLYSFIWSFLPSHVINSRLPSLY